MTPRQVDQAKRFITRDMWRMRLEKEPLRRRLWIRPLRVGTMAVHEFIRDNCPIHASALTYFTLLSLVPVVALAFAIAKGFGLDETLETQLREFIAEQTAVVQMATTQPADPEEFSVPFRPELMDNVTFEQEAEAAPAENMLADRMIDFARNALENTRGGVIAGIGAIFLLYVVLRLMSMIEIAMNSIWHVSKARSLARKFSDYLAVMLVAPLLFLISNGVAVFIRTQVGALAEGEGLLTVLAGPARAGLFLLPVAVMTALFTFVYIFMPNGRVKFVAAIVGGAVAALLYYGAQQLVFGLMFGASNVGAIYGTFAALPLFLILVQVSWMIVLFGAEVSFAWQYSDTREFDDDIRATSPHLRRLAALMLTEAAVRRFRDNLPPHNQEELARETGLPMRLVDEQLQALELAGVLAEVSRRKGLTVWQPAMNIENLRLTDVLDRLDHAGIEDLPIDESAARKRLEDALFELRKTTKAEQCDLLMKEVEN